MAGIKSVQMFHDMFHENSVHNKEDREGLASYSDGIFMSRTI